MKKVSTSLNSFLNEGSKSILLKRKYGQRNPVSVSPIAPLRNKVLAYVAENVKVSKSELREFINGLNEGKAKPAATTMWLKRNSQYFIAESKNGQTFYKLSDLGRRIVSKLTPQATEETNNVSEAKKGCGCGNNGTTRRVNEGYFNNCECECDTDNDEEEEEEDNIRGRFNDEDEDEEMFMIGNEEEDIDDYRPRGDRRAYDFMDTKKGFGRPGIYDMEDECTECNEEFEEDNELDETMKTVIQKIRKRREDKINEVLGSEEEEEQETGEEEAAEHNALAVISFDEECSCDKEELVDKLASIGLIGNLNDEGEIEIHEINQEEEEESVNPEDETEEMEQTETEEVEESTESTEGKAEDVSEAAEKDEDETEEETEETEEEETETEDNEEESEEETEDEDEEKVEIQGFIITVEDKKEALKELEDLGIEAEDVEDAEDQIKVGIDNLDALKTWLEEKGIDLEELLGGEVEEEEAEEEEESEEAADEETETGDDEEVDMSNIDFSSSDEEETQE